MHKSSRTLAVAAVAALAGATILSGCGNSTNASPLAPASVSSSPSTTSEISATPTASATSAEARSWNVTFTQADIAQHKAFPADLPPGLAGWITQWINGEGAKNTPSVTLHATSTVGSSSWATAEIGVNTGSHDVVLQRVSGIWYQVLGTQEYVPCQQLASLDFPLTLAQADGTTFSKCLSGSTTVAYPGPNTDSIPIATGTGKAVVWQHTYQGGKTYTASDFPVGFPTSFLGDFIPQIRSEQGTTFTVNSALTGGRFDWVYWTEKNPTDGSSFTIEMGDQAVLVGDASTPPACDALSAAGAPAQLPGPQGKPLTCLNDAGKQVTYTGPLPYTE